MSLFAARGETAQLLRDHDWSASPLGDPEHWPHALRTIVPIMLASRFAMRVMWGPTLTVLYNDAYRPVLGDKHPRALGRPMRESYEDVWDIVGPMFARTMAGETIHREDTMLPLVRAGYREEAYFTLSYSPIQTDDGAVGGVLGVVYETTERVLAERRLRTLQALSAHARGSDPAEVCRRAIGVLATNPYDVPFAAIHLVRDGKATLVDAAGISSERARAIRPTSAERVFAVDGAGLGPHPEPVISATTLPLDAGLGGAAHGFATFGINPRRAYDAPYAAFLAQCGEQLAAALHAALAAEKQQAMYRREQVMEERLRMIFATAPAAIAVLRGHDLVFELANPTYCQLVGRSELVGKRGRDALPELVAQGVWDLLDEVYATGRPFVGSEFAAELEGRAHTGFFDFTAQPLRDLDGSIAGVMLFAHDVTDQVNARRAEARARADAERSNLAKDEFLAIVSHELRNPLSAMLGWTRMLRTVELSPDKRAQALETIERNAVNQSQLIEDILDVSRIVTGKLKLEVRPVDFVEIVRAAIESARPATEAKHQRIRVVLDDAAVALMGDASRLQQVVWNLLANATKFTPKGGSITVALARLDSSLELTVSDTGAGIEPAFLPHVFERFKQADSTTTRKHGGLGLGLSIVKSIVELHGGTVGAESEGAGQGATFSVRLPVSPLRARTEPERPATHWDCPPELAGVSVLVIDDDPDGRAMVAFVLERCGCRVTAAGSVQDGFAAFERERPQVVLSDIGMPDEDGYALIQRIRALPPERGGTVPAASLTAYAGVEDRRRALNAGFNMHVPKPIDPAELVAVIGSLARFGRALR